MSDSKMTASQGKAILPMPRGEIEILEEEEEAEAGEEEEEMDSGYDSNSASSYSYPDGDYYISDEDLTDQELRLHFNKLRVFADSTLDLDHEDSTERLGDSEEEDIEEMGEAFNEAAIDSGHDSDASVTKELEALVEEMKEKACISDDGDRDSLDGDYNAPTSSSSSSIELFLQQSHSYWIYLRLVVAKALSFDSLKQVNEKLPDLLLSLLQICDGATCHPCHAMAFDRIFDHLLHILIRRYTFMSTTMISNLACELETKVLSAFERFIAKLSGRTFKGCANWRGKVGYTSSLRIRHMKNGIFDSSMQQRFEAAPLATRFKTQYLPEGARKKSLSSPSPIDDPIGSWCCLNHVEVLSEEARDEMLQLSDRLLSSTTFDHNSQEREHNHVENIVSSLKTNLYQCVNKKLRLSTPIVPDIQCFGSAVSGLSDPTISDIDLTLILPEGRVQFQQDSILDDHEYDIHDQSDEFCATFANDIKQVHEAICSKVCSFLKDKFQIKECQNQLSDDGRLVHVFCEATQGLYNHKTIETNTEELKKRLELEVRSGLGLVSSTKLDIVINGEIVKDVIESMLPRDLESTEHKVLPPKSFPRDNKRKNKYLWEIRDALFALRRYSKINVVDGARIGVIKFIDDVPGTRPQQCDLIVNNLMATMNSELIKKYITLDPSGKVRQFLMITKCFVKAQGIGDAVQGYPSSYCWAIMCLHFLLRFEYIPNLQRAVTGIDRQRNRKLDFRMYDLENRISLSSHHIQRLGEESAVDLLHRLLLYVCKDFNKTLHCMTLRGVGNDTIVPKSLWHAKLAWRLCIEDPFERLDSIKPHDLGTTLNHDSCKRLFLILEKACINFSTAKKSPERDSRDIAWRKLFEPGASVSPPAATEMLVPRGAKWNKKRPDQARLRRREKKRIMSDIAEGKSK